MTKADHSTAPARVPFSALPEAIGALRPALRARRLRCVVRRRREGSRAPTKRSRRRSARCATSTIVARPGPRRTPATAPASSSRFPTGSSVRSPGSTCRPPARTAWAWRSCPLDPTDAEKTDGRGSRRSWGRRGSRVLGWRAVPIDDSMIGPTARSVIPSFRHLFIDDPAGASGIELDRKLFVARKRCEHEITNGGPTVGLAVYFPSLSCRTLVYKGMLTTPQLPEFFPDLRDERVESALALVHSRFSTNTFPSWPLAHPYRYIAHNGEINTRAGQPQLDARARVDDEHAARSPGSSASSRSPRPARPTPRASTSVSSCWRSAAGRSGTACS